MRRGRWLRQRSLTAGALAVSVVAIGGAIGLMKANAGAAPLLVSMSSSGPGAGGGSQGQTTLSPAARSTHTGLEAGAGSSPDAIGPSGSAEQIIAVEISPGPLTVTPDESSVLLERVGQGAGSGYHGVLSPVRVVDGRGSLLGWKATITLQALAGATSAQLTQVRLCVFPDNPTLVAGNTADVVRSAHFSCVGLGASTLVFWAAPGGGGGSYTDGADLVLHVPSGGSEDSLTASLNISVH
jgi:hypothetical protein